jgi:hypothetical protein
MLWPPAVGLYAASALRQRGYKACVCCAGVVYMCDAVRTYVHVSLYSTFAGAYSHASECFCKTCRCFLVAVASGCLPRHSVPLSGLSNTAVLRHPAGWPLTDSCLVTWA